MEFHEAAEIFPLDEENLQGLSEDIGRNGQMKPIEVLDGKILDGRRRFKACKLAGVEPEFKDVKTDDPVTYVLSLNLHRRHLSETQRSVVGARAKPLYEKIAKERLHDAQERGRQKQKGTVANLPQSNGETKRAPSSRDMAAEAVGVSGRSIDYATDVLRRGTAAMIAAVEADKIAVSTASRMVSLEPEEQDEYVANVKGNPRVRKNEVVEKETDDSEGVGVLRAHEALNHLIRIPKNDPSRLRGFKIVTDWIKAERRK